MKVLHPEVFSWYTIIYYNCLGHRTCYMFAISRWALPGKIVLKMLFLKCPDIAMHIQNDSSTVKKCLIQRWVEIVMHLNRIEDFCISYLYLLRRSKGIRVSSGWESHQGQIAYYANNRGLYACLSKGLLHQTRVCTQTIPINKQNLAPTNRCRDLVQFSTSRYTLEHNWIKFLQYCHYRCGYIVLCNLSKDGECGINLENLTLALHFGRGEDPGRLICCSSGL